MIEPLHNPFHYGASHILQRLDPSWRDELRTEIVEAARELLAAMGTMINPPRNIDNGTLALVILCQLLREHGGALVALSKAHEQLHAPGDDSYPPQKAW